MTLPVIWTDPAVTQLEDLHEYIADSSLTAADSQAALIMQSTDRLGKFPELGRPGRRRGTRELVIRGTPYIAAYRIRPTRVEILAVIHGARRWPRAFGA